MAFSIEQGSISQILPLLLNFNNRGPLVITRNDIIKILEETEIDNTEYKYIDIVMSKYDKMIYMEDDTLISKDFIRFAEENLERYEKNNNISIISAQFEFSKYIKKNSSYFFSPLLRLQGFATWKRVWKLYEKDISKIWYDNIFKIKTIKKFNNFLHYIYFSLVFNS